MADLSITDSGLPPVVRRRLRRYRMAAWMILVFGLAGAAVVYWLTARRVDYSDDPAMVGFNRAAERQMGVLYGQQGRLFEGLDDWLKRPGTKAMLVAAVSAVIALGCYLFSRLLEFEARGAAADGPLPAENSPSPAGAGDSGQKPGQGRGNENTTDGKTAQRTDGKIPGTSRH